MRKKLFFYLCCYSITSCVKVPIPVTDNTTTTDPNISFFDNYEINLSTYKVDSFLTSGTSTFIIGQHNDSVFGKITAHSYAQIELPASNPIENQNVSLDSIVLVLQPNGKYYGDTTNAFTIQAYRLMEKIENEENENDNYYNPRTFVHYPQLLGSNTSIIKPNSSSPINIRLPDSLGQALLSKFRNNHSDIEDNDKFTDYFKGIYLTTDTLSSKTVYYFTPNLNSGLIRLYYRKTGLFSEEQILDFPLTAAKQFNHIAYNHTGTALSVFQPFKNQLRKSNLTENRAFLHNTMLSYVKISFPSILKLKELNPYVRILRAELVIPPATGTYRYPYQLPKALHLFTTDDNNTLKDQLANNMGPSPIPLSGNLFIDHLYGEKTSYTYNITNFINSLLGEGRFSKSALMLVPSENSPSGESQRLVINDQTQTKGIQLKLYVLGL